MMCSLAWSTTTLTNTTYQTTSATDSSWLISKSTSGSMTSYTLCICATFLHSGWANGSSEFHFDQWFFTLGTRVELLPSVHKQMSAQGSRIAEWLFALCSSTVWLFITVNEYVLFQFSSLCEWLVALCTNVGIPPVWKSIWVLRFPAWLNDFLHSVHSCSFSPLWVSICRIMWLRNSCTRCICMDSLQCVFWWCDVSSITTRISTTALTHRGPPTSLIISLLSSSTSNLSLALKVSQSTLTSPYCNQSLALKNCNPSLASPAIRYNYGTENWSVSLLENDKICIILPSLWVILVYTRIAFLNIIRELRISPYLLGGKWDSNSRRL